MAFKPAPGAPAPTNNSSTPIDSSKSVMNLFEGLTKTPAETPKTPKVEKPTPNANTQEEEVAEEASNSATEMDQPEDTTDVSEEAADSPEGEEAALPENVIEVPNRGKKFQFTLDKNDKKLHQTLAAGLEYPKLAADRKALKRELEAEREKTKGLEGNSKYSEAREMAEAGFMQSAVKEFLGEDLYKKFFNEAVIGRIDYENATPEERVAIDRKLFEAEKAEYNWKLNKGKDKSAQADAKTKEAEVKAREVELESYAKSAIAAHDFKSLDPSREAQEEYKVSVYRLAMQDIEDWVETAKAGGRDVTPTQAHIEAAIARKYKLLTGQIRRAKTGGNAKPASSASGKKAAATASKNYDKGQVDIKDKSPLGIFNALRGN